MFENVVAFIRELYNKPSGVIALHEPCMCGNEKKYVMDVIESSCVSSGEYVNSFEKKICEVTGAGYAVSTVNGTAALHTALLLAGVRPNDEVITQPLTFIATVNAVSYSQAHPVFIDVTMDSMGLSPDKLEEFLKVNTKVSSEGCVNLKTGRTIKACVPMHTFGFPCRIDEIVSICRKYHIQVVEDAAESLGSLYKDKHTGTFGRLGIFSFNGNKIATSGGGGCIITDDDELAAKGKHLTTTAKVPHSWEYHHDTVGYNYSMPNLCAALAYAQLEQLPDFIRQKKDLANRYRGFFREMKDIEFVEGPVNSSLNYWLNAIKFSSKELRDTFLREMNDNGILARPVWSLTNKMPMYAHCQVSDLTNAEALENEIVNLPSSIIKNG